MVQSLAEMAAVSSDLLWQLVKKNNRFLVKRNGNGSNSMQFSSELNNLYNLNTFKYSGKVLISNSYSIWYRCSVYNALKYSGETLYLYGSKVVFHARA